MMTTSRKRRESAPVDANTERKLVDEAERGFACEQLRPRPAPGRPRLSDGSGPSPTVTVRLDDDLDARLREHGAASGDRRSDIVREAIREYLARQS